MSLSSKFFNIFSSKFLKEYEYPCEYPSEYSKIMNEIKYIKNNSSGIEIGSSDMMKSCQINKTRKIKEELSPNSSSGGNKPQNDDNNDNNNNNITISEIWRHVLRLIGKYEDHFCIQSPNQRD